MIEDGIGVDGTDGVGVDVSNSFAWERLSAGRSSMRRAITCFMFAFSCFSLLISPWRAISTAENDIGGRTTALR